jgi:hypothetical protein
VAERVARAARQTPAETHLWSRAAAAAVTTRLRVGTLVLSPDDPDDPADRQPAAFEKRIATLRSVANDRFDDLELSALGHDPDHRSPPVRH